ncbi:hypothetical protein BpHYR1_027177 [Brachionus plicatilis]|uniref:Uncharacterized protein n=1 Tax=Brachionus plicatilis TaxID=10195 RepID=A0A3M7QQ74_BRAPC|nr:hypothetical protein BpHYR1_027177 [Brachionus plicatilis]
MVKPLIWIKKNKSTRAVKITRLFYGSHSRYILKTCDVRVILILIIDPAFKLKNLRQKKPFFLPNGFLTEPFLLFVLYWYILQWQTLNGVTLLCTDNNRNIIILTIYWWIVSNHHYI